MSTTHASALTRAKAESPSAPSAPAVVQDVIRTPGAPLAVPVRDVFERRLGHNLDNVRIHTDARAADSARAVNARAYNVGPSIVFGAGQFAPETSGGKQLLAHELTHVVQQRGREVGAPSAAAEMQADAVARNGASAIAIQAGTHPQALQRSPADDKEIDDILKAAKKAAKAKPPDVSATQPIFLMIKRYLPQWEKRVSGVTFSDKVQRVAAAASGQGRNIAVSFGRDFVAAMTDARVLRTLAAELETAFIATNVQPDDLELSAVGAAASPAAMRGKLGVTFKDDTLKTIGARDYWHAKVMERFHFITINNTDQRLDADREESAAVLSVLWKMQPKKIGSTATHTVSIPPRAAVGKVQPKALLYVIKFMAPNKDSQKKPRVSVQFLSEGKPATIDNAATPASTFKPQSLSRFSISGFPKNDINAYWKAHPEEKLQVFNWMQNKAPQQFDQIVRVTTGTGKQQRIRDFKLSGSRDAKGNLQNDVVIELLGTQVEEEAAPTTYRDKRDAGDLELETQQSKDKDALGKVDVPRDIPDSESSQIKYIVASYFENGIRNAEVDARVAADAGEVLYTLRFLAGNDVQVERIGDPRQGTHRDPDRLDIGRSREFQQLFKANDVGKLSTFIGNRYPGVTVSGKTVGELRANLNARISADADSPAWFKNNYGLTVLDATEGRKRMKSTHGFAAAQLVGIKDFEGAELKLVEQALEPFSLQLLPKIRETRLVRQTVNFEPAGKGAFKRDPDTSGEVATNGKGERSMRLFDGMAAQTATLFSGGRLGTMRRETETIAHEFGHVVEDTDGIKAKFYAFVAKEKLKPITAYAKKKPTTEFFTEAFSLFQTDPEWLKANQPKLFEWLETVSKTGKPPP